MLVNRFIRKGETLVEYGARWPSFSKKLLSLLTHVLI